MSTMTCLPGMRPTRVGQLELPVVRIAFFVALMLLTAAPAFAQEWARKMFKGTEHEFGAVAAGSKVEHRFQLTNIYKEDIRIASVTSSCGCTTPVITQRMLKTHEKGEIVAVYNTTSFSGARNAVLTVTFDQPFHAEVQLKVNGYIRRDVVLNPGFIELGTVPFGETAERRIDIDYAGRNDWEIRDVRTTNDHLEAELTKKPRTGNGRVAYQLLVRLRQGAPPGYIDEQLTVLTNDNRMTQFPIDVRGKVESEISVSPSPLFLGVVQPGEAVTKHLVIRGKKPFKITGVQCENDCFQIDADDEVKSLHLVPVTFTSDKPGKSTAKVRLETDLGKGVKPEVSVSAQVAEGEEE